VFEAARQMRGEYDHIIPHIEGGLFVAENIRLLCHGCHVKRTSEWRKERNRLKKAALQAAKSSKASP
jgi:5-methylcytosine-specific restriction endonuclease McrA